MPRVTYTPAAEADLLDIAHYIEAEAPSKGFKLIGIIQERLQTYAYYPEMARARPELGLGVRSFPVSSYLVYYQVVEDGLLVMRILHSARDVKNL